MLLRVLWCYLVLSAAPASTYRLARPSLGGRLRQFSRHVGLHAEGLDAESDSVGPGIYGGRVERDAATGEIIIGKQFEEHNATPG